MAGFEWLEESFNKLRVSPGTSKTMAEYREDREKKEECRDCGSEYVTNIFAEYSLCTDCRVQEINDQNS